MHTGLYNHILSNVSVIFWSTPKRLKMAECLLPGLLSRRNYSWLVSIFFILLFVVCSYISSLFLFFVFVSSTVLIFILFLMSYSFFQKLIFIILFSHCFVSMFYKNFLIRFQTFCIHLWNSVTAAMISGQIDQLINRKLIATCFSDQLIIITVF